MRILVLRDIAQNFTEDIFYKTDYLKYQFGKGANVGNKLWLAGLVSTISTPENEIYFKQDFMTADYINDHFDLVISPEANVFCERFQNRLVNMGEFFRKIKIPVFVLACGAAANTYDDLNNLCSSIDGNAKQYIEAVYATGGDFGLRGNFTKSMFEKFGYPDVTVTGCPSMYQRGRNFKVDEGKVTEEEFKPALNGSVNFCKKPLTEYQNSEFFDQSQFYNVLYKGYSGTIRNYVKNYGTLSASLIHEKRVNFLIDLQDWIDYLEYHKFNFSCGTRIHGNIMPVLCGIQSAICPPDARVREMAEFFSIPVITEKDMQTKPLYEIYKEISFKKFNTEYKKNFEKYEQFLVTHKIAGHVNEHSVVNFENPNIDTERLEYIERLREKGAEDKSILDICNHRNSLGLYEIFRTIPRKILS